MRKAKPKVKKKVKAKAKPKKKVKKIPVTNLGNFDDDSDWRLKAVHHNINQSKRAIYDLSINVEGEHDHISKTVQRCHDRIEIVEGLLLKLMKQIDGMVFTQRSPEKYESVMTKEDAEERVRAALENLDGDDNDGR
jgi:hypothetical protein